MNGTDEYRCADESAIADARLAARGYEQCANRCGEAVAYEGELCRECEAK